MGQVIWVELLSRHRDAVERIRCEGPEIRIGRAYDNDVVLDDPCVAPHHVRVFADDDGSLVAQDLGTLNGISTGKQRDKCERIILDGDTVLRIGRTQLRVRQASHPVTPERFVEARARAWPKLTALAATIGAISIVSLWLDDTAQPKFVYYAAPLVALSFLVLAWTSSWAVWSRIFSGRLRFERNLSIALIGVLVYSVFSTFIDYGAFALSSRALATYEYVGTWAILATICYFHLRVVSPAWPRLKGAIVAALALVAIVAQTFSQTDVGLGFARETYVRRLQPPSLRLVAPQSEAAFIDDVRKLKTKLDRTRSEEPPAPAAVADD